MSTGRFCSPTRSVPFTRSAIFVLLLTLSRVGWPEELYERPPIDYLNASVEDAVARLQADLDQGKRLLQFDSKTGYLASVLKAFDIDASSQMLVFSKTSFQQKKISPQRPRALYFNDHTYVGWVQTGDVLEVSSVDAQQGAIFYTLQQQPTSHPVFSRETHQCLTCHGTSQTNHIPGHFARSVYPDSTGRPVLTAGSFHTDFTSPLQERWGGWYVSGNHGRQRHMGNATMADGDSPDRLNMESGANIIDLGRLQQVDLSRYLTPHSDIVALMVLEHQIAAHNALTAANYSARITDRDARIMNEALGRAAGYESDSTQRRYDSAAKKVVDVLLLTGEPPLTDSIAGSGTFRQDFEKRGPYDLQQRSLRQLDLNTRLFKYPCSYLIHSEAFDALPDQVRSRVLRRLWQVLTADRTPGEYDHLSDSDRLAILEILQETKDKLPDYWHATSLMSR